MSLEMSPARTRPLVASLERDERHGIAVGGTFSNVNVTQIAGFGLSINCRFAMSTETNQGSPSTMTTGSTVNTVRRQRGTGAQRLIQRRA